jgi:GH18 family chitinase
MPLRMVIPGTLLSVRTNPNAYKILYSSISNCEYAKMPSCDGSQLNRKVGYYAGWSAKRACNAVQVSQLDLTGLTHVMYVAVILVLLLATDVRS